MMVYNLCYNNGVEECYSLKDVRHRFRKDSHFYEFLETEGFMFCTKENEKSKTEYLIKPIGKGEIIMEYRYNEKIFNGAYGN